jgi:hypothetical protein
MCIGTRAMSDTIESHDVYLVLHPFAGNAREFRILVRPLGDLDQRYLAGAEGFYRGDFDIALVVLRFTPRAFERLGDKMVQMFCGRSGLPMVIPGRLDAARRRAFFLEHLSGYTTYVQLYPDESALPLGERVLVHLEEHLGQRGQRAVGAVGFDVEANLPVANPRRDRWRTSTT